MSNILHKLSLIITYRGDKFNYLKNMIAIIYEHIIPAKFAIIAQTTVYLVSFTPAEAEYMLRV